MELMNRVATKHYESDEYITLHPDWHHADAPTKARDLEKSVVFCINALGTTDVRIADVGAGTGGVLTQLLTLLESSAPGVNIQPIGFEISPDAATAARKLSPRIEIREKYFTSSDGPFDITLLVDVLEHLENPWEMLRTIHNASEYLIVRQPLLANFSRFNRNNYRNQRETWGHIAYFTSRSFSDMAFACGWEEVSVELMAPWELASDKPVKSAVIKKLITKIDRARASILIDGFYLLAAYKRR